MHFVLPCLVLCPALRRSAAKRRRLCCLQAAAGLPLGSNRSRVWMMLNNISIAEGGKLQCHWPGAAITGPTELHGEVAGQSSHTHAHELSAQQLQALEVFFNSHRSCSSVCAVPWAQFGSWGPWPCARACHGCAAGGRQWGR